jgi:hypothetical protein
MMISRANEKLGALTVIPLSPYHCLIVFIVLEGLVNIIDGKLP